MARNKQSVRKIKNLVFLMLLTLILAITATYAWFSTQRDIEVSGMRLNVEVAESLQISLDGEIWTQSIQIANMRQFYGTYTGTGDGFAIYQAKKPDDGGNTNYVPTELLPVSSAGEVSGGKLQFVQGTIESNADGTTKLKGITACSENDLTATETVANRQNGNAQHPYLVFDMYLRNISAKTTGLDELLLNAGSAVWVNAGTDDDGDQEGAGVAGTGLEYSARVGMVVYGNTISTTATDTQDATIGEQIRGLEADGNEVAAIWEPNNKEHTAYVVSNNGRGITSTSQEVDTYGVKVGVASAATKEIANINATNDANLVAVNTFTPDYTTAEGGVDEKTIITNTQGNNLGIAPNQISKVRIYVWLEGQDPDCIDLASTGDKLNVILKLTKDQTTNTDKNTYAGNGSGSDSENTNTLASVTNENNIGDYIDLGYNIVGTTATTDDWRILYKEGNTIYAILADYLPNSTNYAANAGLDIESTYCVYSLMDSNDALLNGLTTPSNWNSLANGIAGASVTGTPTGELFMNSYNAKNGTSLNYEDYPTLTSGTEDYDLYVPHTSTIDDCHGYWLASTYDSIDVFFVSSDIDIGVDKDFYDCDVFGIRPIVSLPSDIQVTKNGETWIVSNTGTGYKNPGLTAAGIRAADYGVYVTNYTATNASNADLGITGWRIYHTDGTNIYLIADNYVKNTYVPTGVNKTDTHNDTYCFYMTDIAEGTDYTGMGDISSTLKTKLLSKFGSNTNTTSNGKATAYLMDNDKWSGFGNTYTDYAIGGPTLELFAESYSVTHETEIDTRVVDNGSGYGYQLKWSNEEYDSAAGGGDYVEIDYNTIDNEGIYFIKDTTRAYGNWIASPSAGGAGYVFGAVCHVEYGNAVLGYRNYARDLVGARPLVSLKSSVQLEKQEDGSFKIVE